MLGDMTGIGPEISAKVLAAGTFKPLARIAVIGDARVLELGIKDAGVKLNWRSYADVDAIDWSRNEIPLVDLGNIDPATIKPSLDVESKLGRNEIMAKKLGGRSLNVYVRLKGEASFRLLSSRRVRFQIGRAHV